MKEYSKTLTPQGCPRCYKVAICDAALHDFAGVESIALKCPSCGNVWRAANGIQIRNPNGMLVTVTGGPGDQEVMAFGEP